MRISDWSSDVCSSDLHYWNAGAMPRHPDTRQRIERAAVVLFASKGVDATTTKEIAAAVGISEGAIYRHFKSKDELVWHLFSTNYFDLARRIDAMLDETPSCADRIDGAVEHGRESCRERGGEYGEIAVAEV